MYYFVVAKNLQGQSAAKFGYAKDADSLPSRLENAEELLRKNGYDKITYTQQGDGELVDEKAAHKALRTRFGSPPSGAHRDGYSECYLGADVEDVLIAVRACGIGICAQVQHIFDARGYDAAKAAVDDIEKDSVEGIANLVAARDALIARINRASAAKSAAQHLSRFWWTSSALSVVVGSIGALVCLAQVGSGRGYHERAWLYFPLAATIFVIAALAAGLCLLQAASANSFLSAFRNMASERDKLERQIKERHEEEARLARQISAARKLLEELMPRDQ